MTPDLSTVAIILVAVVLGIWLLKAWLAATSALLWMSTLQGFVVIISLAAAAFALLHLTAFILPNPGYASTRLLVIAIFAPLIARPAADALSWVLSAGNQRSPVRPALTLMVVQTAIFAIAATLFLWFVWTRTGTIAALAPWAPITVIVALMIVQLVTALLTRHLPELALHTTRGFMFYKAAYDQQAAYVASLNSGEIGMEPLSDAVDMFNEVQQVGTTVDQVV